MATCRWCSAASKRRCAASRTTTTGRTRCAARSCWTPAPTSCCMAMPNARSSKSRTAWLAARRSHDMTDIRGTAFMRDDTPDGWWEIDSTRIDRPGRIDQIVSPYVNTQDTKPARPSRLKSVDNEQRAAIRARRRNESRHDRDSLAVVRKSPQRRGPVCACKPRAAPGNQPGQCARTGAGTRQAATSGSIRPPMPLSTAEMDYVFGMPFTRVPHPAYGDAKIPAYEMIRFLGEHHARLFWRLHVLFHHRTRRPHHPEPLGGIDSRGSRENSRHGAGLYRRHFGSGRPDRKHVPARLQEPEIEAACRRPAASIRASATT